MHQIDLRDARRRKLTPELAAEAQLLVTMGCGEECPSIAFAYALTRTDSACAGRAYAAYGGIYIVASLVWLC